ncbi:MAG: hypothetical protein CMJ18_11800 [Phycisphaeraceae bacterium]|nr:hypothetical protein [Phycisphaeraceae bacterium]
MERLHGHCRTLAALAAPVLRQAVAARDGAAQLASTAALLLLEQDESLHAPFVDGFRTLCDLAPDPRTDDPAPHRGFAFTAHLHLAAFARRFEALSDGQWCACEEAIPALIEPLRACERFAESPPPDDRADVVLWQALCILEQAAMLRRDIDAEWVDAVVHQVVGQSALVGDPTSRAAALQALCRLALLARNESWSRRVAMLVQPRRLGDPGESARPWDLFALAWIDRTQESADAMVEDLVHRAPPDVDDALILADCCDTIGMFPEG